MTANTIYSTAHKLGLDTTHSNQQTIMIIQPLRKGIALARQISIDYDKLYDIYELHDLGEENRKQKRYYDPPFMMERNLYLQTHEQDCNQPINCEICLQFSRKNKRIPIFNKGNQFYSANQEKIGILSPQDLLHQNKAQEQQSSIYYTCRSDFSQT